MQKEEKEIYINDLFSRIAKKYDQINDLMTFSLHRKWKELLVEKTAVDFDRFNDNSAHVIDLCTGTGDIAGIWQENPKVKKILALDTCQPMLDVGIKKYANSKIIFKNASALEIPYEDNSIDALTVGFGLRNVGDLEQALNEIRRVLKPGGFFASLDLGHPDAPFISWAYKSIFLPLIPALGLMFAKDKAAYQYLKDSLETWPDQKTLTKILLDLDFTRAYYKNLMLGSVALVVGQK